MNQSEKNFNSQESESLYITALLFKHKIFIISFVMLVTIASGIMAFMMPVEFRAEANVVPPKQKSNLMESALGSLSSALSDFGLTSLGDNAGGGYSFLVILQSRSLLDSIIDKYELSRRYNIPLEMRSKIYDKLSGNMDINLEKTGNYTIAIWDENPDTAALIANDIVGISNNKAVEIMHREASQNRQYLEERLAFIDSRLVEISDTLKKFSRENKVYSPLDQASAISKAFAELKAQVIQSEVQLALFKSNYGENDPYTQMQQSLVDELKVKMNEAENSPGFAGDFSMSEAADIGIEYMKMAAEFEAFTKVKVILMPMLEKAKLDEGAQERSLYVVDAAISPDKKDRPKRSLIVAGAGIGSFALAVLFVLLVASYKNFKKKYNKFIAQQD